MHCNVSSMQAPMQAAREPIVEQHWWPEDDMYKPTRISMSDLAEQA